MRIVLVSGSHREVSQSLKVAKYLAAQLPKLDNSVTTDIIGLRGNPLPLWDDAMWKEGSDLQKLWEPYNKRLRGADGFVIVSPEWHGMAPAGLKNFFLYCGNMSTSPVAHKPAMLVGVSASRGGSYPVAELRMSSYKNTRICYTPEHLLVQYAEKMMNDGPPADKDDEYIRARADYALKVLLTYAKAMKGLHDSVFDKKYANGM